MDQSSTIGGLGPGPGTGLMFLWSWSGPVKVSPGLLAGPGPVLGPDPATLVDIVREKTETGEVDGQDSVLWWALQAGHVKRLISDSHVLYSCPLCQ